MIGSSIKITDEFGEWIQISRLSNTVVLVETYDSERDLEIQITFDPNNQKQLETLKDWFSPEHLKIIL